MNGSETLMAASSLGGAAGLPVCRRGSGLPLLIALAALALAAPLLGLTLSGLTALGIGTAATLAGREIGRRCTVVGADQDFRAVGQVGEARGHYPVGGRKAA